MNELIKYKFAGIQSKPGSRGFLAETMNKSQKGFTLIGLLIIVVVLGVLAAITVPSLDRFRARDTRTPQTTDLAIVPDSTGLIAEGILTDIRDGGDVSVWVTLGDTVYLVGGQNASSLLMGNQRSGAVVAVRYGSFYKLYRHGNYFVLEKVVSQ